jgi:asparagine synthase (glutamine-hydrolysing)
MGDKLLKLASILTAEHPESMYGRLISSHQPGGPEPAGTPFTDSMAWLASPDVIPRIMYLDIVTYLPGDILVKLDRASMSVGLEARVPFLDPRVMEFAWRLPMDMKIRGRQSKWILRQVLNRYVPNPLIRRSKAGFSIPLASWLRGPLRDWADSLLSGHSIRQTGFFDPRKIQCLWSEHCRGARNWERPLWQVLMFQAWLDSRRPASKVNRNVCSLTA